jgi:hypothetical protein
MSLAFILVRWLHVSASILLASLFLFEAAILVPAVRKPTTGIGHHKIHRLACQAALWTLLVALNSWFARSWLVASTMTGDDFGAWNLFLLKPRIAIALPTVNVANKRVPYVHCFGMSSARSD